MQPSRQPTLCAGVWQETPRGLVEKVSAQVCGQGYHSTSSCPWLHGLWLPVIVCVPAVHRCWLTLINVMLDQIGNQSEKSKLLKLTVTCYMVFAAVSALSSQAGSKKAAWLQWESEHWASNRASSMHRPPSAKQYQIMPNWLNKNRSQFQPSWCPVCPVSRTHMCCTNQCPSVLKER